VSNPAGNQKNRPKIDRVCPVTQAQGSIFLFVSILTKSTILAVSNNGKKTDAINNTICSPFFHHKSLADEDSEPDTNPEILCMGNTPSPNAFPTSLQEVRCSLSTLLVILQVNVFLLCSFFFSYVCVFI
jgi:hypothetical protein